MRKQAIFMMLTLTAVLLSGCSSSSSQPEEIEDTVNKEEFTLGANLGAIAGLLVDDRFRPIDLEDEGDARGEFQAEGFVLLQETGERRLTNENGEFSFVDLEPGTYTLRVSASGHEAVPQRVSVSAGEFAEAQVLARRKASVSNTIVTEEYSGFVPCATGGVLAVTANCLGDLSGNSYRPGPLLDFTKYEPDLYHIVIEAEANQAGNYDLVVREDDGAVYGRDSNDDYSRPYFKVQLDNNLRDGIDSNWDNNVPNIESLIFFFGQQVAGVDVLAGARVAVRSSYLLSIFLGEAEVDLEAYCIKCENTMA